MTESEMTTLCQCGCGQPAPIAKVTMRRRGYVKGQPQRYIRGHSTMGPLRKCAVEWCDKQVRATYCANHAGQMRATGSPRPPRVIGQAERRFWEKVDKTGDCWVWTGARDSGRFQYGIFAAAGRTLVKAHRFSYELHQGAIPDGMVICHRCDNPPCVRPDHLFAGTQKDNIHDMDAKGRGKRPPKRSRCPKGHPYDGGNTAIRRDGAQACRVCRKSWSDAAKARRVAEGRSVACPKCQSPAGAACKGRFGEMSSVHDSRVSAAQDAPARIAATTDTDRPAPGTLNA